MSVFSVAPKKNLRCNRRKRRVEQNPVGPSTMKVMTRSMRSLDSSGAGPRSALQRP